MNDHDEAMPSDLRLLTNRKHVVARCDRLGTVYTVPDFIERNRTLEAERDALLAVVSLPDPEPEFYEDLGVPAAYDDHHEHPAHIAWRKRQEARAALKEAQHDSA